MNEFPSHFRENADASIGFSFIRVYNLWHRKIKSELQKIELTHPQFVILATLGYLEQFNTEITQINISQNADMDVMTVSTILKNMENKQWIIRFPSEKDTRAKAVSLTEKGSGKLAAALPVVESIDSQFFGKLAEKQMEFNQLLHIFLEGGTDDD